MFETFRTTGQQASVCHVAAKPQRSLSSRTFNWACAQRNSSAAAMLFLVCTGKFGPPKEIPGIAWGCELHGFGCADFFWEHLSWIHPEIIKHKMPHAKVVLRMLCWSLNINFMTGTRQKKTWDFVQDGVWLEYWILNDIEWFVDRHFGMFKTTFSNVCEIGAGILRNACGTLWVQFQL